MSQNVLKQEIFIKLLIVSCIDMNHNKVSSQQCKMFPSSNKGKIFPAFLIVVIIIIGGKNILILIKSLYTDNGAKI